jgi:MFS transporter, MHS family, proline/betaine transporter
MKTRTIIAACSIGNFLEWYDYALYGYLTSILARIFFPINEATSVLFNTTLIFAIGFVMRPLGSIIFGLIGDREGRKIGLILSILCMTVPTIMVGLLPTYLQIGVSSVIFLAVLRIFQGIPIGGEVGGIMCYLTEIGPAHQRGFFGSWSFFGAQIGFVISSLEIYLFEIWMSPAAFESWGWRLSFIIGGLLGVCGWYLRRRLHETHAFQYVQNHHQILKSPVTTTFKNYKKQFFQTFCLSSIAAGAFYVSYFFSAFFLMEIFQLPLTQMLLLNAGILTISCISLPIFGKLGDRFGIKRLLILSSMGVILLPYFMFYFAVEKNLPLTLLFQLVLTLFLSMNYALIPAFLWKIFPTPVRYTGVGVGYNLSNAILGGPAPLLSVSLIKLTGNNIAPAFYFILLGVVSLIPFFQKDHALEEIK